MAILVTGGAGYIGSATVECLLLRGERVVVLDDLARGHRAAVDTDVPFFHGNVGDRALVARIAAEHDIESCIHFAALAYVGESVTNPSLYLENNIGQGMALVGALLQASVHRIVFSSTCATYGEPETIPICEQNRQWPTNPYGWSKLFMEQLLSSYDKAYGIKFVALRYFNAAGATAKCGEHHEPETHLIPNVLATALGEQSEVEVFGNTYPTPDGTPIRDYIHIADLAEAHVLAVEYLRQGGASQFLNLGTGSGFSVLDVIECARGVTGRPVKFAIKPPRPGDPSRLVADAARAHRILGWRPRMSELSTIIQTAWDWRLKHPRGYVST